MFRSSVLFPAFTVFFNFSHTAFADELVVRPETAGLMKVIRDLLPLV